MDVLRIKAIEYCDNGSCEVMTERMDLCESNSYKLADYCFRPSWLCHFQLHDLETIWQLTKRQLNIGLVKRCVSLCVIRFFEVQTALRHWEEDLQRKVAGFGDSFDEW